MPMNHYRELTQLWLDMKDGAWERLGEFIWIRFGPEVRGIHKGSLMKIEMR